jgi:hypothetical protein
MTDSAWERVLSEIDRLHTMKQADYGTDHDPYNNLRSGEPYGVPAWLHTHIMCQHKANRVQSFVEKGSLENEHVRDSLIDLAVYAIAAVVLFDESSAHPANVEAQPHVGTVGPLD